MSQSSPAAPEPAPDGSALGGSPPAAPPPDPGEAGSSSANASGAGASDATDAAPDPASVTGLLLAWGGGDQRALEALLPIVYGELHARAARALRRENAGHTLQPTALVHEAYLRLVDQRRARWENRAQFYGVAAQAMRRVLVDHARGRRTAKRGGGADHITLGAADAPSPGGGGAADDAVVDVLALDDALAELGRLDPQQARVVELRYFAGLSIEETAEAIGVSPATVKREWAVARAWLRRALSPA